LCSSSAEQKKIGSLFSKTVIKNTEQEISQTVRITWDNKYIFFVSDTDGSNGQSHAVGNKLPFRQLLMRNREGPPYQGNYISITFPWSCMWFQSVSELQT
jgi:hypothetical protein